MSKGRETAAEVRRRLNRRLELNSAELAIQALEEVAADKKAPAPARATAGTALLRAAGYLDQKSRSTEDKQPHEMTGEELQAEIDRLRSQAKELSSDVFDAGEGVFE
jgi:hypothetical protein